MHGTASPFDYPVPRGLNVVLATLRIAVALQCWGFAVAWLNHQLDFGIVELVTRSDGGSELMTAALTRISWGLVVCGLITLVRPFWPALIIVIGWFAAVALIGLPLGDRLRPLDHAVRYLTPLCLILLDPWPPQAKFTIGRANLALLLLRIGIVLTFSAQGLLALQDSQEGGLRFDLIRLTAANVLQSDLSLARGRTVLGIIGGLQIGLALALLVVRSRILAGLMATLGGLLAMCWVFAYGSLGHSAVLLHAADAGAPAALGLYWMLAIREQPAVTLPSTSAG